MNQIDVNRRSVGINFNSKGEAEILLWAPFAERAELALTEDQTRFPLKKAEFGYWELTTDKIKPHNRYKFILDGEKELPDPASLSQPDGVHGASEALDLNDFVWTDDQWVNIPLNMYLIYELHTGTFTSEGTFSALEKKLDHLKNLGINAIEFMPVAQFPGTRNWGYDGVFPYAVQNSYGGMNGLKSLINSCHKKGLAVILDVVYNHLGPEGNYLNEFGPYFTDKYKTPWGKAINYDDSWCDNVRRFFIENALMWFRDFHIDALRLDAVHAIKDFSPTHILSELKHYVKLLVKNTGRKHYLIAESDLNDKRFIDSLENKGYGMDSQWIDEFHHALRVTSGGERKGYYSDFLGISHLAKAYHDAYVYDGIYSEHRHKTFGTNAAGFPGEKFIVFSQNHDQVGNRMLGERSSRLVSFEMQKLMAAAVLVSPFIPLLFMGEEWSEPNPFLYFVSHTDPGLIEAVRKGRKAEFSEFHAQGEAPDPQAPETFLKSKLQWNLLNTGIHETMYRYYQTLISIRKKEPALYKLNRQQLNCEHDEKTQTLILWRWHENQHIVCLMNFSKVQQKLKIPDGGNEWNKLFDTAETRWAGPGAAPELIINNSSVNIQPESMLIYKSYV